MRQITPEVLFDFITNTDVVSQEDFVYPTDREEFIEFAGDKAALQVDGHINLKVLAAMLNEFLNA
jgi:hypothetical protein